MFLHSWSLTCLLAYVGLVAGLQPPSIRTVYQFPNASHAENIAVRANGQLLVTAFDIPTIYQISPTGLATAQALHTFPHVLGLFGIAEVRKDIYAVVAGNLSLATFSPDPESFSVWKVDLSNATGNPVVSKITDVPQAGFLNGLSILGNGVDVLIADSTVGVVYRVNTITGAYAVVIDDPLMKPLANTPPIFLGINGLHVRGSTAYFTNTDQKIFGRVSIHSNGTAACSAEIFGHTGVSDDFALSTTGTAYVANENTIKIVAPSGAMSSFNTTGGPGSSNTSPKFGRTLMDSNVLYVTGYTPVGNQTVGRILAVSL